MPTPVLVNVRSPIPVQAERMKALEQRQADLENQVSANDRLIDPSVDPAAANRASQLARQDARYVSDQSVITRNLGRLSNAESHIQTATDILGRASELALTAANSSYSAADRAGFADEVALLRTQLLEAANARDESGRYLFAGSRSASPAYVLDETGAPVFQGIGVAAGAEAAGLADIALPTGLQLFGNDADGAIQQLTALEAALREPDAATRNAALQGSISALASSSNRLVSAHATLGVQMARLDSENERIANTRVDLAAEISAVRGVNLIDVFTELTAVQNALSASQTLFSTIYRGSLFDRLG